jgi:predicted nucleic acid-binding protein
VQNAECLVLDANILIRAVLGKRVRTLLCLYGASVRFYAPEFAFAEAREHLPTILEKRNIPISDVFAVLDSLNEIVQEVNLDTYFAFEQAARQRLAGRDIEDWPVLAAALALQCPIWTEDTDFFGTGIATWKTDRVELYLQQSQMPQASISRPGIPQT